MPKLRFFVCLLFYSVSIFQSFDTFKNSLGEEGGAKSVGYALLNVWKGARGLSTFDTLANEAQVVVFLFVLFCVLLLLLFFGGRREKEMICQKPKGGRRLYANNIHHTA